jgi:signal transduction histidine kinase
MEAAAAPAVRVDALELFVELLSRVESSGASDDFYGPLCEATCRLANMDRAVIFRYDEARRRVRATGGYGIDPNVFADANVTVESAPVVRRALVEDTVIEVSEAEERDIPPEYRSLLRDATLVCTPISAGGHWSGVLLSDRAPRRPLTEAERDLLWTLGKTAALVTAARTATFQQARARQLQERIDLARDVHEGVIQRLFGVQLAFASDAELPREARERIAAELQAALSELRRALQRPLGRTAPDTHTTLLEEVRRLQGEQPDLGIVLSRASGRVPVPRGLEALAQSVLGEAVRNARKHARPSRVDVTLERSEGAWVMEISNDGVSGRIGSAGMGLRLAALEALQAGGIVEFGRREPDLWRVRLAVPLDRA